MTTWREIEEFPDYSVSDEGLVKHDRFNRILRLTQNQQHVVKVGLSLGNEQFTRSVALLVAKAFLPEPVNPNFNTPINLDGDRTNNRVENLMWRPRWFAIKYHQQFTRDSLGYKVPIIEIHSGEKFKNSHEAATTFGLLEKDIALAIMNRTYTFPTYQEFRELTE